MKTYRGIYHNLNESEYAISNGEVAFHFSSRFYMDKFLKEYKEHRIDYRGNFKLGNINEIFRMNLFADFNLYNSIEKRGYKVTIKGIDIQWLELHEYALQKQIGKNTVDWFVIQGQS